MTVSDLPLMIVNPKSGRGISERSWASMAGVIRTHFGPFECEFTRGQFDASRLAEEQARKGRKWIIAVGGDGTISEIANGILRSGKDTHLSILPGGTGGDIRKTLKIPARLDQAAAELKKSAVHRVDVGRLSYKKQNGKNDIRYFVNTASFGMSGLVAGRAHGSNKFLGGRATYAIATMKTMVSYKAPEIFLKIDDRKADRIRILTVCVANGPSFGGGMRIAPNAKLDDGFFDVIVIGDLKMITMMFSSYRLYTGSFLSMDKVAEKQAKLVEAWPVDGSQRVSLEVDGETPGYLPAKFEIVPSALSIRL